MIRRPRIQLAFVAVAATASLAVTTAAVATTKRGGKEKGSAATATLRSADGRAVGKVLMRQDARGSVSVSVQARGLKPGFHGFHVHEKSVCKAPSQSPDGKTGAFLSAGGHAKSGTQTHGAHDGDMPPLFARQNGAARATFVTDSFDLKKLLDRDGSAAMIHAGPDNLGNIPPRYLSGGQPGADEETKKTGDSGDRVACGVLRK